jgi:hypothetical protein
MPADSDERPHVSCPACNADVAIEPNAISLHCDHCGNDFFLEHEATDGLEAPQHPPEHELDALRIRQRMTMVRSAYRSRSYAIIAAVTCVVLAVQSVLSAIHRVRIHSLPLAALYVLFAIVGAYGTVFFFRKAIALHRDARRTSLEQPVAAPDFTTLGDGSQRVRNLEEIR